jgi:hypothetical protein
VAHVDGQDRKPGGYVGSLLVPGDQGRHGGAVPQIPRPRRPAPFVSGDSYSALLMPSLALASAHEAN